MSIFLSNMFLKANGVSVGVLDPDHIYDMFSLLVNDFIILYLEYSY